MKVWIVYDTSDYEGCGPPAGVYSTETAALAIKAAAPQDDQAMIVVEEFEIDAPPKKYRGVDRR